MDETKVIIKDTGKSKGVNWKIVSIGGASGVFLGTAAVVGAKVLPDMLENEETEAQLEDQEARTAEPTDIEVEMTQEQEPENAEPRIEIDTDGDPASGITDDMTFEQAFAAARAEMGPGGTFTWHGGVYGTYYESEWRAMSDEQRADFTEHAYHNTAASQTESQDIHTNETPVEEYDNVTLDDAPEVEGGYQDDDSDFQILGCDTMSLDDGSVATVGMASVDNQDVFFIDIDDDGVAEFIAADVNQDGQIDESELADISDQNVSLDPFSQVADTAVAEQPIDDTIDDSFVG